MSQVTLEQKEARRESSVDNGAASRVRSRWRRFKSIGEFVLFLIVGLLLLEPILKVAGIADEENYIVDSKVGWTPVPNRSATYRSEGYSRYTINSLGMRDVERTVAKPANTYRIAVVGCSLTEGKQVPIDQTYCQVLEKRLNARGGPVKYEVLNFAVSAYTLGQEYLRLKHFAMQFKPDLVLFTVRPNALLFMGPDSKKGFFESRPVFGLWGDGSLVEDRNYQKFWLQSAEGKRTLSTTWLSTHSRLYAIVGKCAYCLAKFKKTALWQWSHPFTAAKYEAPAGGDFEGLGVDVRLRKTMSGAMTYLGKVAAAIVKQAKSECESANCRFAVVYLPATLKNRDPEEEVIVRKFPQQLNVDFIDLNPEFDRIEKTYKESPYVICHPSKFGHQMIAQSLQSHLQKLGLLAPVQR